MNLNNYVSTTAGEGPPAQLNDQEHQAAQLRHCYDAWPRAARLYNGAFSLMLTFSVSGDTLSVPAATPSFQTAYEVL